MHNARNRDTHRSSALSLPKMCNLYRMKGRDEEIANLFRVEVTSGANFGEEV